MSETNREILDFIKQWLQKGDIKRIAEKDFEMTAQNGYDILADRTKNFDFIEACYQKALERANKFLAMKEQTQILKQKIASL